MSSVLISCAFLLLTVPSTATRSNEFQATVQFSSMFLGFGLSKQQRLNAWHGLMPLRSTRDDVELVLGTPSSSSHPDYVYNTEKEKIIVRYSTDPCNRSTGTEWNVPVNTVVTITVSPKADLLLRDLHLDLRNYARSEIAHPRGLVHYISLEDGVGIESKLQDGCEIVMSVTYQPTTKDKEFRCRNFKGAKE